MFKLNNINKEHDKALTLCDNKMDISAHCFSLLDSTVKKIELLIVSLEQQLIHSKFNDFSYQNSLLDKNLEELLNFENYLLSNDVLSFR